MYLSEINGKLFIQDGEGLEIPVYAQLFQGLVAQSPKKDLRRCRGFSTSHHPKAAPPRSLFMATLSRKLPHRQDP